MMDKHGWISVSDYLPPLHENVLMLREDFTGYYAEVGWWSGDTWLNGREISDVYYWQPVPEYPVDPMVWEREEEENEG